MLRVLTLLLLATFLLAGSKSTFAETPDEQFEFATGLYSQKLWSLAAQNLRKFLDANPNHTQAKVAAYQLGAALYRAANDKNEIDYAGAAAAYEKAIARFPDAKLAAAANYELGDIYFNLKSYQKSVGAYTDFLKSTPPADQAAEAQLGIGEALYALNKPAEARSAYQLVVTKYPQSRPAPFAQRALGYIAEDANDFAAAVSAYKVLLDRYPTSELATEAKLRYASALLGAKRFDEATKAFRATIDDPAAVEWKMDALLGLADAHFGAKNWNDAASSYAAVLAALKSDDERRSSAQLRLADSYFNAKKYQEAASAYAPLTTSKDAKVAGNALYFGATAQFSLKQFEQAAAQYRKLLDAYPQHEKAARAALRMGDALAENKDAVRAAEAYRTVVTKYSASPEAKEANEALLALVSDAANTGDAANVDQLLRGLPPGTAASNAQLRLAQTAMDKADYPRVVQLVQGALAGKPDAATAEHAIYLLGTAHLRSGDATAAMTAFRKQVATYPKGKLVAEGQLGLAWALLDSKQWAAAENAARSAVAASTTAKQGDLQSWSKLALSEALMNGGKAEDATVLLTALESSSVKDIASQATYNSALALEGQNQWGAAAARWAKYSALAPAGETQARAFLRQGLALAKAKKSEEAIVAFDRASAADAQGEVGARALYESAWLAHDLKRADDEAARWQKLEKEYSSSRYAAEAALQQGETKFDAKAWDEAIVAYARVTERYPQSDVAPMAWYKLASAHYNKSNWNEAAAAFDKAAGFSKSEVALESNYWAAESLRHAGRIVDSRARYEGFIKGGTVANAPAEIKELVPAARLGLGQALLAQGNAVGAAETLRIAANSAKGAVAIEAHFALGEALSKQAKFAEASTQFLRVSTLYPNSPLAPRAQWEAAQSSEQAGDKKAAQELLKVLSARQPADEWSTRASERLKTLNN